MKRFSLSLLPKVLVFPLTIFLVSCDPSYRSVVEERGEDIKNLAAELTQLKESLPEAKKLPQDAVELDLPAEELPYFHIRGDNSNLAILATDVINDIRTLRPFDGITDYFDFPGNANSTLQRIANPESGRDSGWFTERVDGLLNCRYFLIVDFIKADEIEILNERTFRGGTWHFSFHLYDRESKQWILSETATAIPKAGYAFGAENTLTLKLRADIKAEARDRAAELVKTRVEAATGGTLSFDYNAP